MATSEPWPPDYVAELGKRQKRLRRIREDTTGVMFKGAREFYRTHPHEFIEHWCVTYDPRNAGSDVPTTMPFIMFNKQKELVDFLLACLEANADGLDEKTRDMGATWICVAFTVWLWLFWDGVAIGWGSRKQEYVDKLGDPDSIFQKIRITLQHLPREFMPSYSVPGEDRERRFNPYDDVPFMKIINPATGSSITGEVGDSIGRGGRKRIYFKDESAHYERPELIEASLGDNTNVQIDISSVNGLGNVFERKRAAGIDWRPGQPAIKNKTNVFVMDWSDHPAKTLAWWAARRAKAVEDGLLHVFEQEVNRNYSAAIVGAIIPAEWILACVDAHLKIPGMLEGAYCAALDVADSLEGDTNALTIRKGVVLTEADEWGERDTGRTARKAIARVMKLGPIELQYDSISVGAGVKSEANRMDDEGIMPSGVNLVPWDAGAAPFGAELPDTSPKARLIHGDKNSPLIKDFYGNLKAQGWWELRGRFERTFRMLNEKGVKFDVDTLISLDSRLPLLSKIVKELAQPVKGETGRLKMIVEKQPEGTRSPNLGDSTMMNFWPMKARTPMKISDSVLSRSRRRVA